ncbi:hypothetical protein PU088_001668 [Citrobacter farmeri]|uniref:Uncharacterized protein n=1 Tax=Citrobacter amalonaticus Y19 TaxID=1261127 RepID=M1K5D1_CITAM|nr:hypothetical protein [Citrobacter amalonaticus]AGE94625.1 hypothetical protein F384_07085 [Citrobacter amalonaticus Y19]EKV5654211.1 hypothetical protein [Citrobacter farmeri]
MSELTTAWQDLMESIEAGWRRSRRSDRVSLLPIFNDDNNLQLKFDVNNAVAVTFDSRQNSSFRWAPSTERPGFSERTATLPLQPASQKTVYFDGLALNLATTGHVVSLFLKKDTFDMYYELTLQLDSVSLSPVLAESNLHRSALRNMTAEEAGDEPPYFSANCGEGIVIADAQAKASLKIVCESGQPGRDTTWTVTLQQAQRMLTPRQGTAIQISHTPFIVSQLLQPELAEEAGNIIAQWKSDDPDGAQWRFGIESVSLNFPPQAVGEAMVRGDRFRPAGQGSPIVDKKPIPFRFSRRTELTVRPSRVDRRYTVHPGDTLSVLRDAELTRMVSEMAYPLELTYQRTPELQRTVIVSEIARALGQPAIALPVSDQDFAMSPLLETYFRSHAAITIDDLKARIKTLRTRHLAARQNFVNRLARFTLKDANYPLRKLDLTEGMSAILRGKKQGATAVWPLPEGASLSDSQRIALDNYVDSQPNDPTAARSLPIGLLYSIEFASELMAVLHTPVTKEVRLLELTLSVLGATGAVQAAFDEGRTQFDASVENGQLSRLVKTRYGRIATVWNKARHVVVYSRSTVPGAQFAGEQKDEEFLGRPLLRKMEEYIEILEPYRLFDGEASAAKNKPGCLHAFHFATQRIYVNGAWGHDVDEGYEIPVFNELDSSGFYVKPWAGPVARGGGDELTQHWHDQPQHLYFFSSTKVGAGADTDTWEAQLAIDCDENYSFGRMIRLETGKLLEPVQVPSLTLQALANPRFSMPLRPEGVSNIVHGRGTEELVASIRTMQIERTLATRRVDLSTLPDDEGKNIASLIQHATYSAELKSLDATLQSLFQDAKKLWALFEGNNLETFKARLKKQVDDVFDECTSRLTIEVAQITPGVSEAIDHVKKSLGLARSLSVQMIDELCAQGHAATDHLLTMLSAIHDPNLEVESVKSLLASRYVNLPVQAFVRRSAESLNGAKAVIADLRLFCAEAPNNIAALCPALREITTRADTAYKDLLGITDRDALLLAVDAYCTTMTTLLREGMKSVDELSITIGALKFPAQWQGPQHLRDMLTLPLTNLEQAVATYIATISKVSEQIRNIGDLDAQRAELQKQIPPVLAPLNDTLSLLETFDWQTMHNTTTTLGSVLAAIDTLRGNLFGNATQTFFPPWRQECAAYQALVKKIEDNKPIDKEFADFVAALEALNASLRVPAFTNRSPFSIALTDAWNREFISIDSAVSTLSARLDEVNKQATALLSHNAAVVKAELDRRRGEVKALIEGLSDAGQWVEVANKLQEQVAETTRQVREQFVDQATRLFDQKSREYAKAIDATLKQANRGIAEALPKAGQAIKLVKLLSDPPQLPQLTIRTDNIEYVFDDLKDQIETSPFVARLREVDAGIKELGLTIPSCELNGNIVPASLRGVDFSQIVRNTAIDFENFFKKFKLPDLPDDAIRISHHIDPKTRSASIKAVIDHQFTSTESLFEIPPLSLDVRKPTLVATSDVDISPSEATRTRTQALFSGDWILNFSGQPLVTFADARIQYSEASGFTFDLDPKNIEPHAALKFIGDVLRGAMPEVPPYVEIVKNKDGIPTGASVSQKQAFGPLEYGGVSLGQSVLASGFRLNMNDGMMQIETYFGIGEKASPVSMQIGVYGGGGWLTTRAAAVNKNGKLTSEYEASIGVALVSTKTFNLAGVAEGSYAIRLFVEAGFSSDSSQNFFAAGVQMTGSAKVLGYLTAWLNLLVQVEHRNGQMKGRGHLDISIEVCWCYTAHISRTVEQDL